MQDSVADRVITIIADAAAQLRMGDPADPATQIGQVIDAGAKARLEAHVAHMRAAARTRYAGQAPDGCCVAPHVFEIAHADELGCVPGTEGPRR